MTAKAMARRENGNDKKQPTDDDHSRSPAGMTTRKNKGQKHCPFHLCGAPPNGGIESGAREVLSWNVPIWTIFIK
jgi:hypothetical protein